NITINHYSLFFFSLTRPHPRSPLFPYTTLFRSTASLCDHSVTRKFEDHAVRSGARANGDAKHDRVRTDLEQPTVPERIAGLQDVTEAIRGLHEREGAPRALHDAGELGGGEGGTARALAHFQVLEGITPALGLVLHR